MNGIKTGLGITPGEHIISADSALSRNIRHCFCLSCHGRLILQTDAQGAWFEHDLHALSEQQKGKRAARTVLTGMCYSVGSATRQGEQFADPVYRPVGYDVKDIAEVAFWLHSVQFARPDQAVQQRSPLSSMIRTEEQVDGMTFIYSL